MQIRSNQVMHGLIRMGDPTRKLADLQTIGQERKRLGIVIARLEFQLRVIDGSSVEPGGGSRLEPLDPNPFADEGGGDARRGPLACPPAGGLRLACVHHRLQEGSGGQDHGIGLIGGSASHLDATDPRTAIRTLNGGPRHQIVDSFLPQTEIFLQFHHVLDSLLIGSFVRLSPGAMHGRTFSPIEQAELDSRRVNHASHRAAEGVHLANDLPFGDPANGRIAAHLGHRVQIAGEEGHACPHPRRGQSGFGAGMPGPDHHDVELIRDVSHEPTTVPFRGARRKRRRVIRSAALTVIVADSGKSEKPGGPTLRVRPRKSVRPLFAEAPEPADERAQRSLAA